MYPRPMTQILKRAMVGRAWDNPARGLGLGLLIVPKGLAGESELATLAQPSSPVSRLASLALYLAGFFALSFVQMPHAIAALIAVAGSWAIGRLLGQPVALCVAIGWATAHFSGATGGASGMHEWLIRAFGLDAETAWNAMVLLRKGMHFFGYGLLAQSARAIASRLDLTRPVALGLLWCLAHAAVDEARQAGTPGRTGTLWDVVLNLSGAVFAMAVAELLSMGRRLDRTS